MQSVRSAVLFAFLCACSSSDRPSTGVEGNAPLALDGGDGADATVGPAVLPGDAGWPVTDAGTEAAIREAGPDVPYVRPPTPDYDGGLDPDLALPGTSQVGVFWPCHYPGTQHDFCVGTTCE